MVEIEWVAMLLAFLLILVGLIYTFLKGIGKISDAGGEIESRIITLKGGSGLILVALGIILLVLMGLPQSPHSPDDTTLPANTPSGRVAAVPTSTTGIPPVLTPRVAQTVKQPAQETPNANIIGTWSAMTDYGNEIVSLYSDNSFELTVYHYTGETTYISGDYALSGSTLYVVTSAGDTVVYTLTYVGPDNININGVNYERIN